MARTHGGPWSGRFYNGIQDAKSLSSCWQLHLQNSDLLSVSKSIATTETRVCFWQYLKVLFEYLDSIIQSQKRFEWKLRIFILRHRQCLDVHLAICSASFFLVVFASSYNCILPIAVYRLLVPCMTGRDLCRPFRDQNCSTNRRRSLVAGSVAWAVVKSHLLKSRRHNYRQHRRYLRTQVAPVSMASTNGATHRRRR